MKRLDDIHENIITPMATAFPFITDIYLLSIDGMLLTSWHLSKKPSNVHDHIGLGTVSFRLLEDTMNALDGDTPRYSVSSGDKGLHLLYYVGYTDAYLLSMYITGNPPLDPIISYIADRDHLSEIERLFKH
ncbi:MAG: hypothetical protein AAFQ07_02920 [Chloroflexota bacterium]